MKSVVFFFVVLCALTIGVGSWESNAANEAGKQQAVTRFDRPAVLQGVTLKGEYLFVHDEAAMKRGEHCTYVYKGNVANRSKLVLSFHCIPIERTKATHFVIRSVETLPGTVEVQEFQFKGDTEAHGVPATTHAHVNMTN